MINLARNLDLRVVAEGVETEQHLATLVQLNCEYLQGCLFARPLAPDGIPELVEQNPTWTRAGAEH